MAYRLTDNQFEGHMAMAGILFLLIGGALLLGEDGMKKVKEEMEGK